MAMEDKHSEGEPFEFTWTIENFDVCPHRGHEFVSSPWFEFELEGQLRAHFRLKCSPRETAGPGGPEEILCSLECVGVCARVESYEVSLLDSDGSVHVSRSSSDLGRDGDGGDGDARTVALCRRDKVMGRRRRELLRGDSLSLRCKVWTAPDPKNAIDDVVQLSRDMKLLLETSRFSDLVLSAGGAEFPVHKFVVHYRARELAKRLGITDATTRICIENVSPTVLGVLLSYLYSGELEDVLTDKEVPELHRLAAKYGINLMLDAAPSAADSNGRTTLRAVRKSVLWKIKDYSRQEECAIRSYVDMELAQFVLVVSKVREDSGRHSLQVSVQRVPARSASEGMVYLSVKVSAAADDAVCMSEEREHWFQSEDDNFRDWLELQHSDNLPESREAARGLFHEQVRGGTLPESAKFQFQPIRIPEDEVEKFVYLPVDVLALKLELSASTGEASSDTLKYTLTPKGTRSRISNLMRLKHDLYECMVFRDFADARISVRGAFISAHKAILAARSPGFRKLLRDGGKEGSGELPSSDVSEIDVDVASVDSKTVYDLMEYIYAGQFTLNSAEAVLKLYDLANRYEISILAKKCAAFLMSN